MLHGAPYTVMNVLSCELPVLRTGSRINVFIAHSDTRYMSLPKVTGDAKPMENALWCILICRKKKLQSIYIIYCKCTLDQLTTDNEKTQTIKKQTRK